MLNIFKAACVGSGRAGVARRSRGRRPLLEPLEGRVVPTLVVDTGNTLGTALNLGVLSGRRTHHESIGDITVQPRYQNAGGATTDTPGVRLADPDDFYRLTLSAPGALTARIDGLSADANIQIIRDANNNRRVDPGEVLTGSYHGGSAADEATASLGSGTYFVRVYRNSGNTNYNLTLTTDFAGNSLTSARNLGVLNGTRVFSDFVGATDTSDFYRLTLWTPGALTARIDGLSADANVQIIRDANNNGIVDPGEVQAGSYLGGSAADEATASRGAGTYFVRVYRNSGDTNYNLTLTTYSLR